MTTTTLRLPGRIERLSQLRRIARGGLAARGSVGAGLAAKAGGAAVAGNGLLNNLVAYWALDEAAGANNALDKHSNALTLTQTGSPGSDTGKVYVAARTFDNSDDYFARASEALLVTGDIDFTVAAWCYITTKSSYNHIASKWQEEWLLRFQGGIDRLYFEVKYGASSYANVTANNYGSPPLNTWLFVVAWHDSTNNQLAIQVNNGTANTTAHTGGVATSSGAFNVGCQYGGALKFAGRVGPVAFWKRVLSTDDRTALYNSGAGLAYAAFTT